MGVLVQEESGERFELLSRTLVGRSPACDLRIGDPSVSAEHAVVAWQTDHWEVRDLGSRNGTRVGRRGTISGPVSLEEGARIAFGGEVLPWVLASAAGPSERVSVTATHAAGAALADIQLLFTVSRDEEHAHWEAVGKAVRHDLGDRVHTYLLVTLARARLDDAALPVPERGWRYADELAVRLGITPEVLKVYVYRARQQLAAVGIEDASRLVERRATTNQIRLGVDAVAIRRA